MPEVPDYLSPRRAQLASFENAYAVALRLRADTGQRQLILCTGNPLQPYRVVAQGTELVGALLALVA